MQGGGDLRVSNESEKDVMMVDVRERDKPPGDPPDGSRSWARTVAEGQSGGMLSPEDVLAEEFVRARLSLNFPDGEDGEPEITIGDEVLTAMNGLWKNCMIVKVLGRKVTVAVLNRKLRELWKPVGGMYVMDLPRQFFMIRFANEDEYLSALTGGPWKAFGSYLMVQAWTPSFDPLRDEITTTPVWVRLSNIPVNFYHKAILMGIAEGIGNPIKVDLTTLKFERARFVRVCVEVNLCKPLKGTVKINGERYFVAYEGLSNICSRCGVYGHLVHSCPKVIQENALVVSELGSVEARSTGNIQLQGSLGAKNDQGEKGNSSMQVDEGFTMVRPSGRRVKAVGNQAGVAASGVGDAVGNRGVLTKKINTTNIAISNVFERLGEVMENGDSMGKEVMTGEGKENRVLRNQVNKEKNVGQGGFVRFGGQSKKSMASVKVGNGSRNTGGRRMTENHGSRPKGSSQNRATRGLVFGPTSSELEMSSNGKRLRVETVSQTRGSAVHDGEGRLTHKVPQEAVITPSSEGELDSLRNKEIPSLLPVGGGETVCVGEETK